MYDKDFDISKKECLTIKEASILFSIGENKLREIVKNDVYNKIHINLGTKILIKRQLFIEYINNCNCI